VNFYRTAHPGWWSVVGLCLLGLAACAPTAAPATPTSAPTTAPAGSAAGATIKLGQIQGFGLFLTDDAGRTLYAFDKDQKDTSNCTGACLQTWPPFTVRGTPQSGDRINASLIATFVRAEGSTQAEYDGHPLYYFAGDKNPGDVKGHGVGGVWHVLSPRGSPMTNPAPTPAGTPSSS